MFIKGREWFPRQAEKVNIMAKYNGHKNWNYWNVSLWINNDQGLYNLAKRCIKDADNRERAAENMLGYLQHDNNYGTPDGALYNKSNIRAAMVGM